MMEENQLKDGLKSYFDINRVMKLSEKFADEEVVSVLEQVIQQLIDISVQCDRDMSNPSQVIKQCMKEVVLLAKDEQTTSEVFDAKAKKMY